MSDKDYQQAVAVADALFAIWGMHRVDQDEAMR